MLNGCKHLLSKLYDSFPALCANGFSENVLRKMDLFTFFLFCYSVSDVPSQVKSGGPQRLEAYLRGYAARLTAYSTGLRQVMENVVNHAEAGVGALSLKRYAADDISGFLGGRGMQDFSVQRCPYLVFEISDYAAEEKNGNLADTFRHGLSEQAREMFRTIAPADFFTIGDKSVSGEREAEIARAWQNYRAEGENLTKHFGLYIFKRITLDADGLFLMESHSTHREQALERYASCGMAVPDGDLVFPGTAYTVCLPLSSLYCAQDNSIDSQNQNSNCHLLKYIAYEEDEFLVPFDVHYSSQAEKQLLISGTARQLQSEFQTRLAADKKEAFPHWKAADRERIYPVRNMGGKRLHVRSTDGRKKVFQFNMAQREAAAGEIWCKALLLVLLHSPKTPQFFAFYNCSDGFITQFKENMRAYFDQTASCNPLNGCAVQVSLFRPEEIDHLVLFPGSREETWYANEQLCRSRGIPNPLDWPRPSQSEECAREIAPLEVICRPRASDLRQRGKLTLFEQYTFQKLKSNIQEKDLGCKIENTHMRLGSTIHISTFYEAELLFSNSLFYSRFIFLPMKALRPWLTLLPRDVERLVLYGYSVYSELLLFGLQTQLQAWAVHSGRSFQVEYIILEREAEQRGFDHTDRLRSSSRTLLRDLNEAPNAKYIMVVPVNSTLKTHHKMRSLLERSGIDLYPDRKHTGSRLAGNFSLITVGPPEEETRYWKRYPDKRSIKPKSGMLPASNYFIYLEVEYNEADTCKHCFPDNPLEEIPLIEVNAASTIPNQSFSLNEGVRADDSHFDWAYIEAEENKLKCVREVLLYGHIERGENHFLHYVETEKLLLLQRDAITQAIRKFRDENLCGRRDYDIVFCPMHFSNAGFVELINDEVFAGSALVIRLDVDKEFRTNVQAKFSNLSTLVQNLNEAGRETTIRVHYVDDAILSGRTFHRAKSLVTSILLAGTEEERKHVSIRIFDTLFLLFNRNSNSSLETYYTDFHDGTRTKCFRFLDIRISSLRTHGNSCVLCNLYQEVEHIFDQTALYEMGRKTEAFPAPVPGGV